MRVAVLLLLTTLLARAGEDRLPREGSGWAGFKPGSWYRTKQTLITRTGSATVTITTMRLDKVSEKTLSLSYETKTALDMDNQTGEQSLPIRGEAGPGEKAVPGAPAREEIAACKRKFDCEKRTVTITGPAGKRVVTNWEAREPRLRVKRTEVYYDAKGKVVQRFSMLLTSLAETRRVGSRKVSCLKYATLRKVGEVEQRGNALLSREVPGGTVRMDIAVIRKGIRISNWRVELVDFETK